MTTKLTIQGKSFAFEENDEIPLGYVAQQLREFFNKYRSG
jgi:hypothetical protein